VTDSSTIELNRFQRLLQEWEGARVLRTFGGPWLHVFKVLAAAYSLVLIYSVTMSLWSSSTLRGLFIMAITCMVFMRYPATRRSPLHRPSVVDLVLIALSIATFGNFVADYEEMAWRTGAPNMRDLVFGAIAIALVLEACRRAMSVILPGLALMLLLYAWFGPYLPGELFSHQGFSAATIVGDVYASMNGIFGFVAYVFIAFVMLFVIMGAIFERFGAGSFFIDFPVALMGGMRGGPAKAAVVASGLFGSISGSATANVVATGTFTIPLMKKTGYRPPVAGAIESAASTGGMFMPPVMGAGAFLMAEMLHMPYADIVKVALVPALLYFLAVFVMVHFEALRTGIGAIPAADRLNAWAVLKRGWYYIAPIVVLFYVLFSGSSASLAAFYAIVSFLGIMAVKYFAQGEFKRFFVTLYEALVEGGDKSLIVGSTAGPVGIIIGIALLSGLAFKFSALVMSYTFGYQWIALLMVMFATFVLGMGITVTADYLILALLAVPGMHEIGIPLLAAHFCVFWYSQSSNVTPPVCMAAFAGASLASAHPYSTGFHAMRFSAYLYVMPFMFVYSPILMPNGFDSDVLYCWVILFLSVFPFAAGAMGYLFGVLSPLQRTVLIVAACLLVFPSGLADTIAAALVLIVAVPQYLKWRRNGRTPAAVGNTAG
jgi:TRAP transporter 4TM/12TM fusion protein